MKNEPVILELGPDFYDACRPASFPQAELRWFHSEAARNVQLESLSSGQIKNHFWAFQGFEGNLNQTLALRYHGHQFRHYNPDLGDGRGFLLAQFRGLDGKLHDLNTKGSGTTPYSRSGDGRLTLKGAVRELLATEMLEFLGVNTSQTFCIFETGESLERQDEPSPARGAVLTRRMHSSLRFGTFQRHAYFEQADNLRKLTEHALENYYPEVTDSNGASPGAQLFQAVCHRTAHLAAQLMMAGFVHGVLNTDNMNISGEVFDFGPFRFMGPYEPSCTAAYFDAQSLYCYGRQPESFLWGLEQLGQALKGAYPDLQLEPVLEDFPREFQSALLRIFLKRLNLKSIDLKHDLSLFQAFFQFLEDGSLFFERTLFDFHSGFAREAWKSSPHASQYQSTAGQNFLSRLKGFEPLDESRARHPYFQQNRPETLLIHEIEALWQTIALANNWQMLQSKIARLRSYRGAYSPL
ncbi:MAG: protein adenylyltransferase SelO family protein [Bdellovibrionales bacterium]